MKEPVHSVNISLILGHHVIDHPNECQWRLSMSVDGDAVTALFPENSNVPDVGDMLPSEVIGILRNRISLRLFSASRHIDLARLAAWEADIDAIDAAWAHRELLRLQRESRVLSRRIAEIRRVAGMGAP